MPKKTVKPGNPGTGKSQAGAAPPAPKNGGDIGAQAFKEVQEVMDVDNFWKLETVIWSRMKVVKVKADDFGTLRYFRIFYSELAASPSEKKEFIAHNIYDQFLNDDGAENGTDFKSQLGLPEHEAGYILETAKRCTPEVYNYFKTVFRPLKAQGEDNTLGIDTPAAAPSLKESERILDLMQSHIVKLQPVHTAVSELTPEEYSQYREQIKNNNIIPFPGGDKA